PQYPYGSGDIKIFRVSLSKFEKPFKMAEWNQLFEEEKKDTSESNDKKKEEKVAVSIDPEGFMERMEQVGPGFGQQTQPYVIEDKGKTYVFYVSNHAEGRNYLWKTTYEDFEETKTEKVSSKPVFGYSIIKTGDKYFIQYGGDLYSFEPSSGKMEEIALNKNFTRDLSREFNQMFYEAWAGVEENFYDEHFHGQDWAGLRDRYSAFLPYLTNR